MLFRSTVLRELLGPEGPELDLFHEIGSTNTFLLDREFADAPGAPRLAVAERQTAGRGRRGRSWIAEAGRSACLSLAFEAARAPSPGLSLAVGCRITKALEAMTDGLALKWPNDLLLCRPGRPPRKLAGLLPRLRRSGSRLRWARLGVGLNGCNPVPAGAIALVDLPELGAGRARWQPPRLAARVLRGLEWAVAQAEKADAVRQAAEALLWPGPPLELEGQRWQPVGLAADGRLRLVRGGQERWLERHF